MFACNDTNNVFLWSASNINSDVIAIVISYFSEEYSVFHDYSLTKIRRACRRCSVLAAVTNFQKNQPSWFLHSCLPPSSCITAETMRRGTLAGQCFFVWIGEKLRPNKVYIIGLIAVVGCAVAWGLLMRPTAKSMMMTYLCFRFWLGFGIGGDYPVVAVIGSEHANQKTNGGIGILVAPAMAMALFNFFSAA
ncbi:hypothetical protein ACLOJK_012253 [Asimina triloba]